MEVFFTWVNTDVSVVVEVLHRHISDSEFQVRVNGSLSVQTSSSCVARFPDTNKALSSIKNIFCLSPFEVNLLENWSSQGNGKLKQNIIEIKEVAKELGRKI